MEVFSMLILTHVATLTAAQQAQLVYNKHFVDPPHQPHLNQNHAPHSVPQVTTWPQQSPPQIAMFPPGNAPPQVVHQPHPPHLPAQSHGAHAPPQAVHQPHPHPPAQSHGAHAQPLFKPHQGVPPGAVAVPAGEFASRRGPIDKMIKGAKQFLPGSTKRSRGRPGTPIRFQEMNRLPKPPKYPLYDMGDLGMATPPPPPLMHPLASATNMFQTYTLPNQAPKRGGRAPPRGKQPPNRRPANSPHQRRPPPARQGNSHNRQGPLHTGGQRSRRPPNNKQKHHPHTHNHLGGPNQFDQGASSSNLDTQQFNSPPLGRPLNYDEYMQRPSHSFTDDPWNFDPYAANYNSGMNTFAMKYNYDPLGMNSLDKTQTHLDPDQLSYPGDTHTLQDSPLNVGKVTQLGGWDKKQSYSDNLTPPPINGGTYNTHGGGDLPGARRTQNSFNQYYDQSDSASIVQSDTLNVNPLKILAEANPGMEFTIESSSSGDGVGSTFKGGTPYDFTAWNNYPQGSQSVYGDSDGQYSHTVNNYEKTPEGQLQLKQLQDSSKFENGNYDSATQLHTFALSQDYVQRDRPVSDFSDSFSPHSDGSSDMSLNLTPPSETAAMFKRQGSRPSRQEKTPMVELEGLSLFNDLLKNDKAAPTRSQLIRVLTN